MHTPDRIHAGSPTAELEARVGVQPLDELLEERRVLIDRVADLRAKYGSFGTWDALRKTELARVKAILRAQYTAAKTRVSNDQLDDEAHGHPDYIGFVTLGTQQRAQFFKLEAQIEAIDAKVFRGNALIRYATTEGAMTR